LSIKFYSIYRSRFKKKIFFANYITTISGLIKQAAAIPKIIIIAKILIQFVLQKSAQFFKENEKIHVQSLALIKINTIKNPNVKK